MEIYGDPDSSPNMVFFKGPLYFSSTPLYVHITYIHHSDITKHIQCVEGEGFILYPLHKKESLNDDVQRNKNISLKFKQSAVEPRINFSEIITYAVL